MPNTPRSTYGDFAVTIRRCYYTGFQVGLGGGSGTTEVLFQDPRKQMRLSGAGTTVAENDIRNVCGYDLAVGDLVQLDPFTVAPYNNSSQPSAALASTADGHVAALAIGPCVGAPSVLNNATGAFTMANASLSNIPIVSRIGVVLGVHPSINDLVNPGSSVVKLAQQRRGGWVDVAFAGIAAARVRRYGTDEDKAGSVVGIYCPAVANVLTNAGGVLGSNTDKPCFTPGDSGGTSGGIDATTGASLTPAQHIRNLFQWGILAEPMGTSGGSNEQILRQVILPGLAAV